MKIFMLPLIPMLVSAVAGQSLLIQEEMQKRFDAAVSSADKMVISARAAVPPVNPKLPEERYVPKYTPVWESTDSREISELSQVVRIKLPPPSQGLREGKMIWSGVHVGGYPDFMVTLKKGEAELLTFSVWKHLIGCDSLFYFSAIGIDPSTLAPFHSKITKRIKNERANQSPEPTATAVTPPAAQEPRQP